MRTTGKWMLVGAMLATSACGQSPSPTSDTTMPVAAEVEVRNSAVNSALSESTVAALGRALDDEYRARATYEAVLERFGDVRPFSNIVRGEQRHIDLLLAQYAANGLTPPEDTHRGNIAAPNTLLQACEAGMRAERDNAALYDELLKAVDDPDVRSVMTYLQTASADHHLPAFQRCVARQTGGAGRGRRGGAGWGSPFR